MVIVKVHGRGLKSTFGLYSSYDDEFPAELRRLDESFKEEQKQQLQLEQQQLEEGRRAENDQKIENVDNSDNASASLGNVDNADKYRMSRSPRSALRSAWEDTMAEINEDLQYFWPCLMVRGLSWLLCVPTLGLSLLCIRCTCMRDARLAIRKHVAKGSRRMQEFGVGMRLVEQGFESWIELDIKQQQQQQQDGDGDSGMQK